MERQIEQAIKLLQSSSTAVALTGAGISTPSGIPDFRSPDSGLWDRHDAMEVATIYAFKQRPHDFYDWMRPLAVLILNAQPNPAHAALAQLEQYGPVKALITQNIDMLHGRAGSRNVYEVHGHMRRATCISCHAEIDANGMLAEFVATGDVPHCDYCGGVLKPNVILFGELLPMRVLKAAQSYAVHSDLMLIAGTSLEVAPAGDLPLLAKQTGARLIIVNNSPTHVDDIADVVIRGDVAEVLPRLAAPFHPKAG